MPKKTDSESRVGHYKLLSSYKRMKKIDDNISRKIGEIYENNIWNLKGSFDVLKEYYEELGQSTVIAWNEDIQYLDYVEHPTVKEISLSKFKAGEYRNKETNGKGNSKKTEKLYGDRIEFFKRRFAAFEEYKDRDDLQWVVTHNRELMYEIMRYNNEENNSIATLSNDLKTLTRIIKLLLGESDELRYKMSSLHIAISELDKMGDDLNTIRTHQERMTFVPYEQLLTICDELEEQYKSGIEKLDENIKKDGTKHGGKIFKLHMILLAFAMNVWNYPSRSENFTLDIIEKESEALPDKNYIMISEKECKLIYNQVLKEHEPIEYIIKSTAIQGLNNRLCKLLNYSQKTYPRKHLFIRADYWPLKRIEKIKHTSVSSWVRNLIPKKNIGIDTFRSAFVSYYYPKFNNQQKNVLKIRMRTSTQLLLRSYLKVYHSEDVLAKVKIEPEDNIVPAGSQVAATTQEVAAKRDIGEQRKENFKKWYANEENKKKILLKQRDPQTYAKRYIRDLNSGKMDIGRVSEATIEKYRIKQNEEGVYYIENEE